MPCTVHEHDSPSSPPSWHAAQLAAQAAAAASLIAVDGLQTSRTCGTASSCGAVTSAMTPGNVLAAAAVIS